MTSSLPININDLLHFHGVESARVELKQSWDEKTTGLQVLKTICAFANEICVQKYILMTVEPAN
ncbi:hypothetical protein PN36_22250 [Candidatus Thiomargarita nelsonii]|uniref:Uncharacterized protein n=1 Tax=Candidatus Thiomargarita nelsonii TaxID=1003181 RepID=A0A4E0QNC1_9GAMM|nr:hypothetical protein PN36_22250 [Candidatus Thiomargarita nelsonii]